MQHPLRSSLIAAIWPGSNASPHPVIPASVSMRTSSMSMLVRARPPSIGHLKTLALVSPGVLANTGLRKVANSGTIPHAEYDAQGPRAAPSARTDKGAFHDDEEGDGVADGLG